MTPLEQAARQALEALEELDDPVSQKTIDSISTLHEALGQPDCRGCEHCDYFDSSYAQTEACLSCTDGDKFQASTPIQLYRKTK